MAAVLDQVVYFWVRYTLDIDGDLTDNVSSSFQRKQNCLTLYEKKTYQKDWYIFDINGNGFGYILIMFGHPTASVKEK